MSLITPIAGKFMTSHEIILCGRSCNILAEEVLFDDHVLITLKNILISSKTFETQYGVPFIDARNQDIVEDLRLSDLHAGLAYIRAQIMYRSQNCNSSFPRLLRSSRTTLQIYSDLHT